MKKAICFLLAAVLSLQMFTLDSFAVHSVIRVGFGRNYAPYQFLDKNGSPSGFHIDILNAAEWDSNTSVEYIVYENERECIQALESGEIDVALGVSKKATFEHDVELTDVLSSTNLCLIASNEIAERITQNNSTVGLLASIESAHLSKVLSLHQMQNRIGFGSNTFLCLDNQKDVVDYLVEQKVDFAICEKSSALYLLEQNHLQDDYTLVVNYLAGLEYYMAVRSGDQSNLLRMNTRLSDAKVTGRYSKLLEKWIVSEESYVLGRVKTIAAGVIGTLVIVALVYFWINRRIRLVLQQRIDEQTHALQDVNDRLTHNLQLLEAESGIRSRIIEDSPSGMLMFTQSGKIRLINKKACELLNVSRSECESSHTDQIAPLKAILPQIDRDSQSPAIVDYGAASLRCIIYRMPEYEETMWLLSFEDVTKEERSKKEQLETEKNRILNIIIAGISHEIKNPLMAIKTYASVVAEQKNNPEFMDSFARYVPSEVERINKLVNSLLNYARPAKGILTPVNIMTVLRECTALLDSLTKKAGFDIVCEGDESVTLLVYQDSLRQAVMNYLMNAIDSVETKQYENGEQGRIDVLCERRDGQCLISVFDNGIGMSAEQLQRCTEPFYTTKAKGSGLGMSIALQQIRKCGGDVRVESEQGRYTKVVMEFEVTQ